MNDTDITLYRRIGLITRKSTTEMNQLAAKFQLENNLFLYLIRIVENEGLSQSDLADLLQVDKTTLSRAIKKLEKNLYIVKETNPINKNFNQLFPTQKTLDMYEELFSFEKQVIENGLKFLNSEEKQCLNDLLKKINTTS
ncbi:winged helix-turn-helix transcriptional regulator [Aerococcaceae bacterium DSM 111176]|nr:winged helix-turn-helix transcriptional regulator [Aerococcaceae bacterium DSM 111176]